MGIKIKNLQTGEFEKFNIPALKGEKGEPGEIEPSEKVDYIGKQHSKLRDTMNANVDYIIKTAIGEFNYLDYEGQHITATNSIEGHSKNAILKGQTLVNMIDYSSPLNANITKNNDTLTITSQTENAWFNSAYKLIGVTYEKKYRVMWDSLTYTHTDSHGAEQIIGIYSSDSNNKQVTIAYNGNDNSNYFEFTVPSNAKIENVTIRIHATTYSGKQGDTTTVKGLKVLEYQQGMENWDIPYFEGMQSVKMPVLTTTGKNLVDINTLPIKVGSNICQIVDGEVYSRPTVAYEPVRWILPVEPNTTYTVSAVGSADAVLQFSNFYNTSDPSLDARISYKGNERKTVTFTTATHTSLTISLFSALVKDLSIRNIQLEKGSIATSYEPYKTNILSTPEEVVLRSLPNGVCDTLNLNTGEYVQRIGEIVLDGSQELINFYNHSAFSGASGYSVQYKLIDISSYNDYNLPCDKLICDKLKNLSHSIMDRTVQHGITSTQLNSMNLLLIKLPYDYSPNPSLATFKEYLSQNPITVQYELATPIVKTVDLSDNVIYSYGSTTHYSCSSEEGSLVPTLSVKVPTDTQLTIQEQKATTQTLLIKNMDLQQSIKEVQAMNLAFNTALYNSFNSIREEVEDIKKHVSTNENLEGSF